LGGLRAAGGLALSSRAGATGERWSLTAEALDRLLALLGPDRDSAALRYEAIRRRLARLFAWRGFPNGEELADLTFDRVARKVEEGADVYAADPYSYLHGVALRIAQEQARTAQRERPLLDVARRDPVPDPEATEQEERRLACLDECLAALPAEARELLRRYHGGEHPIADRRELARQLGVSATALRLRMFRLRNGLHDCVSQCCRRRETERPGAP
jgi:DNA-directed RNA polymerase specialized sigma24 family protein